VLHTPANHLPDGYPLPSDWEYKRFEPIFERAFAIHRERMRNGTHPKYWMDADGKQPYWETGLTPIEGSQKYCDCYEMAYREFEFVPVDRPVQMPTAALPQGRRIILDGFGCVQPSSSK